ncbi:MAG TPA: hypothetical protein GXZ58_02525 [Bacilli bacterium]|nr:hypothetical protein [Bacilli bacterium]
MDPVIDQLFKIEQIAKNMKGDVDDQKEKIRHQYQTKQREFDQKSDRDTEERLKQIRTESDQLHEERSQMVYAQYKTELDLLENVYQTKQNQIVTTIFENIIKG